MRPDLKSYRIIGMLLAAFFILMPQTYGRINTLHSHRQNATSSLAFTTTATIRGHVVDENKLPITNAIVELANSGTSCSLKVKTDTTGYYAIENLPSGIYDLKISRKETESIAFYGISLIENETVTADVILKVANSTITVQAQVPIFCPVHVTTEFDAPGVTTITSDRIEH